MKYYIWIKYLWFIYINTHFWVLITPLVSKSIWMAGLRKLLIEIFICSFCDIGSLFIGTSELTTCGMVIATKS